MSEVEFPRPILLDRVSTAGVSYDIAAEPRELAALAVRFGLKELKSLSATVRLKLIAGGTLVRVDGSFRADVVQTCGVTLAPVPAHVEDDFRMTFAVEPPDVEAGDVEWSFEDDAPDPVEGNAIDIGEAVAEHLSLALDPFPRAPGAEFEPPPDDQAPSEEKANPFAVLAHLRKKEE